MSSADFCHVNDKDKAAEAAEAADHQKLVFGVLVGVVLAMSVGMMLWLVRRNPAKAKKSALNVNCLGL